MRLPMPSAMPADRAEVLSDLSREPDEDVCPECGSLEVTARRTRWPASNLGDCDWFECEACGHDWGHG